mmetsp:Transcript_55092/g.175254  ORF Transcript_55092/g.175254 Transcript_55092/m.175254 type:complete len:309 (-) Transcript_55092:419-1345(-)
MGVKLDVLRARDDAVDRGRVGDCEQRALAGLARRARSLVPDGACAARAPSAGGGDVLAGDLHIAVLEAGLGRAPVHVHTRRIPAALVPARADPGEVAAGAGAAHGVLQRVCLADARGVESALAALGQGVAPAAVVGAARHQHAREAVAPEPRVASASEGPCRVGTGCVGAARRRVALVDVLAPGGALPGASVPLAARAGVARGGRGLVFALRQGGARGRRACIDVRASSLHVDHPRAAIEQGGRGRGRIHRRRGGGVRLHDHLLLVVEASSWALHPPAIPRDDVVTIASRHRRRSQSAHRGRHGGGGH